MTCCINKTNATPVDEEPTATPTEFEIMTFPTMVGHICRMCDNFELCLEMHQLKTGRIICKTTVSVPSWYVRKDKNR